MLPARVRRGSTAMDPWDMLRRSFGDMWDTDLEAYGTMGSYPIDIREDADHIVIEAELPGFKKDEVNLMLENGVLTISAERECKDEKEGETCHLRERRYTKVHRRFSLPTTVDEGNIDAQLHEGVLTVKLTKREEVKPRRISVK